MSILYSYSNIDASVCDGRSSLILNKWCGFYIQIFTLSEVLVGLQYRNPGTNNIFKKLSGDLELLGCFVMISTS